MENLNKIRNLINGGGLLEEENKQLIQESRTLAEILKENEDLKRQIKEKDEIIERTKKRTTRVKKELDLITLMNFNKIRKTTDYKELIQQPEIYEYLQEQTAFDKIKNKTLKEGFNFRDYQENFIKNWSISQQELTILYYGVGSGKTLIASMCAEQFQEIENDAQIYFLLPASLIVMFILSMYKNGINPERRNKNGEYIYYFMSYQQLLNSTFDFKKNSLLIIDEAHNLRNLASSEITKKVSARKRVRTGEWSLVGSKLAIKLQENPDAKFLRMIMMTGTLLVNSIYDLEALMSIGYKKKPQISADFDTFELIINDPNRFDIYYGGLISYYKVPFNSPFFPKKNYILELINSDNIEEVNFRDDRFYLTTRNQTNSDKTKWMVNFLLNNSNKRTLIYVQYVQRFLDDLIKAVDEAGIKNFGVISGRLSAAEKQNVVSKYNDGTYNILIFTLSIKEGISFKETDNFIFAQPYWNYAITEQVIARGVRLDSHKNGSKSKVDIYMLCTTDDMKQLQPFKKNFEFIMNKDIKNMTFNEFRKLFTANNEIMQKLKPSDMLTNPQNFKYSGIPYMKNSRDIDMYYRMFWKQITINIFEKELMKVPSFEKNNDIENNEFIKHINELILQIEEKENRNLTNKQIALLKRKEYKIFYQKQINKINSLIKRMEDDYSFRTNRNPDLSEDIKDSENIELTEKNQKTIKTMINKGKSLDEIFTKFNINKEVITKYQANFTPKDEVIKLIQISNIEDDKRDKLYILEPTAGIGNVVNQLITLNNKENFNIDMVEINKIFYQISNALFSDIETIRSFNIDFYKYNQKYTYDYILGNPPFNLETQLEKLDTFKSGDKKDTVYKTQKVKVDVRLYDIHFVARAYEMLSIDGVLCFIISNRFLRDINSPFIDFKEQLDDLKKLDNKAVYIEDLKQGFKKDKRLTKEMETNFGMVYIKLLKVKNFSFNIEIKGL